MLKVDIIICTYNRSEKVAELVDQLQAYSKDYNTLIVVDSSEVLNHSFCSYTQLHYIHSSHKNQPYQRYLGYANSNADVLIYLDDDMEVIDKTFIEKLRQIFNNQVISGVAINFENKHKNSFIAKIPTTMLLKKVTPISKLLRLLSGYNKLEEGKLGLCGIRGKQPVNGGVTEWLSGGAFAARRSALFCNFNFQLFDLFEQKLGMGEDAIIGYGINKQGVLLYHPELFFFHNDQRESTYTINQLFYSRNVIFSRLFLSLEKARLDGSNLVWPRFYYHWFTFWRISGLIINYILNPTSERKNILLGGLDGWKISLNFRFSAPTIRKNYWMAEVKKDND
jgi:glycosyltransferase involved in cell wall biosynthesis